MKKLIIMISFKSKENHQKIMKPMMRNNQILVLFRSEAIKSMLSRKLMEVR